MEKGRKVENNTGGNEEDEEGENEKNPINYIYGVLSLSRYWLCHRHH